MLFHSQLFLTLFLPVTAILYFLLSKSENMRIWILIISSLVFYGYWGIFFLPLLVLSVVLNWFAFKILTSKNGALYLIFPVAINLLILGFFKYLDFALENISYFFDQSFDAWSLPLPLGISFFTFQQISYLVEAKRGAIEKNQYLFRDYLAYVTFFPQLIAGPIVRHNELIHQFALQPDRYGVNERIGRGLVLMLLGIAKKIFVADELGNIADPVFDLTASGERPSSIDFGIGSLAFSFQIYFDFSAYSDMAVGIALIFGLHLPRNFDSPFRAASIRDFWRRWHMTLSRFLRDYIYIPLGGNQSGNSSQYLALMVTMMLGGLWHGAGWNFIIWGGLHGFALILNHWWIRNRPQVNYFAGWFLTFFLVVMAFVFFRSESISSAMLMFASLLRPAFACSLSCGDDLLVLVFAGFIVFLAPTAHKIAIELIHPKKNVAILAGLMAFVLLILVGGGTDAEFIYFQF